MWERIELLQPHVDSARKACDVWANFPSICADIVARRKETAAAKAEFDVLMERDADASAVRTRLATASEELSALLQEVLWYTSKTCPGGLEDLGPRHRHQHDKEAPHRAGSACFIRCRTEHSCGARRSPGGHPLGTTADGQRYWSR